MTQKDHGLSDLLAFSGKSVLITGAAAGMGAATAKRFAEAGAKLLLLDIDEARLQAVQKTLMQGEIEIDIYPIDLGNKEEIDRFWEDLDRDEPDILINNAGIFPFNDFLHTDEEFVQKVLDVNLLSVYWMCQYYIRRRTKARREGSIVIVGSIEAMLPFKDDLAHYSMSKAGIMALTRALARDFGRKRIRVNAVLPGGIKTEGIIKAAKGVWRSPKLIKDGLSFANRLSLGRLGRPDEIARVILFLASDMASYMTGALVPVDGGFLSA
jgi:3-oxoacyl-[acyl-carrier protein] reductase